MTKLDWDRLARKIRITVASVIVLFATVLVVLLSNRNTSVSVHDQKLILSRVNRFADRYDSSLSPDERSKVATDARLSLRPPYSAKSLLALSGMGVTLSILFILLAPQLYVGLQLGGRYGLQHVPGETLFYAAFLVVVSSGAVFSAYRLLAVSPDYAGSGGFVSDHRLFLQSEHRKQLRNDDELTNIVDHELTHLFGEEGFRKIQRDSWLAYAYSAVFALERGGLPTFERETAIFKSSASRELSLFYRGIIYASVVLPSQNAESEFMADMHIKISPNVRGDSSETPGTDANRASDFGIAGIAWYLSGANADIALSYLDDRSYGLSPREATERLLRTISHREQPFRTTVKDRQQELFDAAGYYMFLKRIEAGKKLPTRSGSGS